MKAKKEAEIGEGYARSALTATDRNLYVNTNDINANTITAVSFHCVAFYRIVKRVHWGFCRLKANSGVETGAMAQSEAVKRSAASFALGSSPIDPVMWARRGSTNNAGPRLRSFIRHFSS